MLRPMQVIFCFLLLSLSGLTQAQEESCHDYNPDYKEDLCVDYHGDSEDRSLSPVEGGIEVLEHFTGEVIKAHHWHFRRHYQHLYPPPYLSTICVSRIVWCYMPISLPVGHDCACRNAYTGMMVYGIVSP